MIDKTTDNVQWVWRGPESKEGIDFQKRRLDGHEKSNDVDRKISLCRTFRYNLLSLTRKTLLRIEAARRAFEPCYRQESQPRHRQESQPIKPEDLAPFLSGFLSAFFVILLGFILFKGSIFLYGVATPTLQTVYSSVMGIGEAFRSLYEIINSILHLIGDLIGSIINWISSIHLTENADRIVIPNPFYNP